MRSMIRAGKCDARSNVSVTFVRRRHCCEEAKTLRAHVSKRVDVSRGVLLDRLPTRYCLVSNATVAVTLYIHAAGV
eukprot:6442804-Pyramimonas_sp.AAC.2